MGILKP